MWQRRLLAAVLIWAVAAPGRAEQVIRFDDAWRTQAFSLFSSNTYALDGNRVTVASDGSVSLAWRRLPEAAWGASSASWRWAVAEGVPPTDLTRRGGDDRNLALYFVFLPDAAAQTLKNANVRSLLRNEAARVLVYVWGGSHARGALLDSPYLGARGKTIVLRPSGTGEARENVDLSADYARAFGGPAPALVGLALSGDSDDTDTRIRATLSDLRLR